MIEESLFLFIAFAYALKSYISFKSRAFDKSVFESAEMISARLKDGHSIESAVNAVSRSDLKCCGMFKYMFERIDAGDNMEQAACAASEKYGPGFSRYLAKIIGISGRYNQNLSGIFSCFYKDMRSAYFIGQERRKELGMQSFIVFLLGVVLIPVTVVVMSRMFDVEIPMFVILFLFAQSYISSVSSSVITGELIDSLFLMPIALSVTALIIKYGLGVGFL
ncbi:MAG: type II secretion system F family protein [archaeon]|nr:type II secretion system F family protein [archaeon]